MLLHESRRGGAHDAHGEVVLLEEQDRSLWDREQIAEGTRSSSGRCARGDSGPTRSRRRSPPCTPRRRTPAATDWAQIVGLYDVLLARSARHPSSS
jgi:RNA polymerase sigma-70 factor, ECF subfamily